ncbi:MAG TPA: hypothetical protein VHB70_16575 [Parafilimonas sp.]|nr:hypothetical protein [Parafilimonas sp.]
MENKNVDVQQELLKHLSKANLSKEKLSSISKAIASENTKGFRIIDWRWLGTPVQERFVLEGELELRNTSFLQNLYGEDTVKEIKLLRKGIPVHDFFNVVIEFENII